ncbi:MAG: HEAT repeat domain-containing protein [Pirellulales bacterium]
MKRWRDWLGGPKAQQAIAELDQVTEPAAVPAISEYMLKEEHEDIRRLYMKALAKIGSAQADVFLAERSLKDPSSDIRVSCLDYLDDVPQQSLVDYYIRELRSKDNDVVNRAGVALSRFKDPRAVGPMIDALITIHKYQITTGSPGGISAGRGTGGPSLGTGSSTRIISMDKQNEGVLDGLVTMLGGKINYRFDVAAWRHWYNGQKKQKRSTSGARNEPTSGTLGRSG